MAQEQACLILRTGLEGKGDAPSISIEKFYRRVFVGGRLFMLQPFSAERFELEKNFPRSKRFWETFKFALVP